MHFEDVMGVAREERPHIMAFVPDAKIAVKRRRTSVSIFDMFMKRTSILHIGRFGYRAETAASLAGRRYGAPEVCFGNTDVQFSVVAPAAYGVSILRRMRSRRRMLT